MPVVVRWGPQTSSRSCWELGEVQNLQGEASRLSDKPSVSQVGLKCRTTGLGWGLAFGLSSQFPTFPVDYPCLTWLFPIMLLGQESKDVIEDVNQPKGKQITLISF